MTTNQLIWAVIWGVIVLISTLVWCFSLYMDIKADKNAPRNSDGFSGRHEPGDQFFNFMTFIFLIVLFPTTWIVVVEHKRPLSNGEVIWVAVMVLFTIVAVYSGIDSAHKLFKEKEPLVVQSKSWIIICFFCIIGYGCAGMRAPEPSLKNSAKKELVKVSEGVDGCAIYEYNYRGSLYHGKFFMRCKGDTEAIPMNSD